MKKVISIIITCLLLQGCGAAVVSGLALAGFAAYDRNNLETRLGDQKIIYQGYANIRDNADEVPANTALYRDSHIVVTSFHGNVLIVGQVPSTEYKSTVTAVLKDTDDVQNVYNQLKIGKATAKSRQAKDSWVTTSVKSALVSTENIQSADFKVLTENGVVYLMGYVSTEQAKSATAVVRHVKGVKKVVTLFDYSDDNGVNHLA